MNKYFKRLLTERFHKLADSNGSLDGDSLEEIFSSYGLPEGSAELFIDEISKVVEDTIEEMSFTYSDEIPMSVTSGLSVNCGECGVKHGKWISRFGTEMSNLDLIQNQRKILPL